MNRDYHDDNLIQYLSTKTTTFEVEPVRRRASTGVGSAIGTNGVGSSINETATTTVSYRVPAVSSFLVDSASVPQTMTKQQRTLFVPLQMEKIVVGDRGKHLPKQQEDEPKQQQKREQKQEETQQQQPTKPNNTTSSNNASTLMSSTNKSITSQNDIEFLAMNGVGYHSNSFDYNNYDSNNTIISGEDNNENDTYYDLDDNLSIDSSYVRQYIMETSSYKSGGSSLPRRTCIDDDDSIKREDDKDHNHKFCYDDDISAVSDGVCSTFINANKDDNSCENSIDTNNCAYDEKAAAAVTTTTTTSDSCSNDVNPPKNGTIRSNGSHDVDNDQGHGSFHPGDESSSAFTTTTAQTPFYHSILKSSSSSGSMNRTSKTKRGSYWKSSRSNIRGSAKEDCGDSSSNNNIAGDGDLATSTDAPAALRALCASTSKTSTVRIESPKNSSSNSGTSSRRKGDTVSLGDIDDSKCDSSSNQHRRQLPPVRKVVTFSTVSIRKYAMELGDNPSCSYGPPVQLSWEIIDYDDDKSSGSSDNFKRNSNNNNSDSSNNNTKEYHTNTDSNCNNNNNVKNNNSETSCQAAKSIRRSNRKTVKNSIQSSTNNCSSSNNSQSSWDPSARDTTGTNNNSISSASSFNIKNNSYSNSSNNNKSLTRYNPEIRSYVIDIELYEQQRIPRRRQKPQYYCFNYYQRRNILLNAGFDMTAIKLAEKEVDKIKRQRYASRAMIPLVQLESTIKNVLSVGKRRNSTSIPLSPY